MLQDTQNSFTLPTPTSAPLHNTYAAHPAIPPAARSDRQAGERQQVSLSETPTAEIPTPHAVPTPTSAPVSPAPHILVATSAANAVLNAAPHTRVAASAADAVLNATPHTRVATSAANAVLNAASHSMAAASAADAADAADAVLHATPMQVSAVDRFELPVRYFPQTGHNVWGQFLVFYNQHGGVAIFGLPLTEVLQEDGTVVQYFERARLELEPSAPQPVSATSLGILLAEHHPNRVAFQPHEPDHARAYIEQTSHTMDHWFYDFWQQHGGAATFGNPISEAFVEMRMAEGQPYRIQYFERARFEAPLDNRGYAQTIHLGLIGQEYVQMLQLPPALLEPTFPIEMLGSATVFVGSSATGSVQNVLLATRRLNGLSIPPGQVGSFLNGIGEVTVRAGYTAGAAIVGGEVVDVPGGGICYVSTLFYRAALNAGLEIVERYPHTLALREFSDMPGLDAAVFTPDMDMRLRNDTPGPLLVVSEVTSGGEIIIRIWGYDDGRTTVLGEPSIAYYEGDSAPIWRYDETLPENTIEQIGYSAPGMHVTVERVVSSVSSDVLHYDQITSTYAPWQDIFLYGPGIDPVCEQDKDQVREECQEYHKEQPCNEDDKACAEQDEKNGDDEADGEQQEGADNPSDAEGTGTPPPTATPTAPAPTAAPPAVLSPTPVAPTPAPTEELPVIQNEDAPHPTPEGAPPAEQPAQPTSEDAPLPAADATVPPLVQPEGAPPPAEELAPPSEEKAPRAPRSERDTDVQR